MKGWTAGNSTPSSTEKPTPEVHRVTEKDPPGDAPPVPEEPEHHAMPVGETVSGDEEEDEEPPRKPLWGPTRCCISCVRDHRLFISTA